MKRFQAQKERRQTMKDERDNAALQTMDDCLQMWVKEHENDIFRYWVYRKVYTPYEEDQKFMDESYFEDDEATFAKIVEAIPLVDGNVILGLSIVNDPNYDDPELMDYGSHHIVTYHRFSDIDLEWYGEDNGEFSEVEETSEESNNSDNWYDHSTDWDENQGNEDDMNNDGDSDGGDDE